MWPKTNELWNDKIQIIYQLRAKYVCKTVWEKKKRENYEHSECRHWNETKMLKPKVGNEKLPNEE